MAEIKIIVPPLGESISEATIANWAKKEGDYVNADELVAELETDKVTLEVNAPQAGVIEKIMVATGGTVEVGAVIAVMKEGGAAKAVAQTGSTATITPEKTAPAKTSNSNAGAGIASPAASKLAKEQGISLSAGTGKDGRITKGDVLQAAHSGVGAAAPKGPREERVRMSKLRQKIAERLKHSQDTAAILTTFNEIDMTHVMAMRNKYKDSFAEKHGVKLGFMSFFVRAAIKALQEIPSVNAELASEEIIYKHYYDIGVAVGGPQGLVVPVVRDADAMSFAQIEQSIADFGKKARDGKLTVEDMSGGTFTISNGGVYGSLLSTPIINPPQTGILGLHKIQERPVAVNGKVEIRPMMYVALSYDHRLIDGKEAVTFLVKVKEAMEDPERLLLDV